MKHVFITTGAPSRPAPDFETLSPHPRIAGARVLPTDGRVSIADEEWTIRGARAVFLMNDQPFPVDYTGAEIIVIAPVQIVTDCTFSIGIAGVLRIEESDGPPVVLTAFGRTVSELGQAACKLGQDEAARQSVAPHASVRNSHLSGAQKDSRGHLRHARPAVASIHRALAVAEGDPPRA